LANDFAQQHERRIEEDKCSMIKNYDHATHPSPLRRGRNPDSKWKQSERNVFLRSFIFGISEHANLEGDKRKVSRS